MIVVTYKTDMDRPSGVSTSTDGGRNASASLLIEVGYFFSRKKKQPV